MPRFVAFLRGASPQNCSMARLRACLENAGLKNVKTVLASGNAAFDASSTTESRIESKLEALFEAEFDRSFYPIVRSVVSLEKLLDADPFQSLDLPRDAKRIVSFLRAELKSKIRLPLSEDDATVFCQRGREVFTAYRVSPKGPVFMKLIERCYGDAVTTRTWDTVRKCAKA